MRKGIDRRIEQLEKRSAIRFNGTPRLYSFPTPGAYVAWCAEQGREPELGSVGGKISEGFILIGPGPIRPATVTRGPWG